MSYATQVWATRTATTDRARGRSSAEAAGSYRNALRGKLPAIVGHRRPLDATGVVSRASRRILRQLSCFQEAVRRGRRNVNREAVRITPGARTTGQLWLESPVMRQDKIANFIEISNTVLTGLIA
jgi:hypothetical protein